MPAQLELRPELKEAFHGIWVYADQGSASVFSLELQMDQIVPKTQGSATIQTPARQQGVDETRKGRQEVRHQSETVVSVKERGASSTGLSEGVLAASVMADR